MSTHVEGFRDSDDYHNKQKAVFIACTEAGVDLPEQTLKYFEYIAPTKDNLQYLDQPLKVEIPTEEWSSDMCEGFEINLEEVPKGVKRIRFYNSY